MLIPHRIYIALPAIPGSFGLGIVEPPRIIDYHELQTFHPKGIDIERQAGTIRASPKG